MAVFVLDQHKEPLMPCSERRARLLLRRQRAVVHRLVPFTIRLKDRTCATSAVQPVVLKLDPGSKTTGVALVRVEQTQKGVCVPKSRTLLITARGRGSYQRTNVDAAGFPRGYLTRNKRIRGFTTGDLVRAEVPGPLKTGGIHVGRVAVRASGSFRVGRVDGISAKYCRVVQRLDWYGYAWR
jgi:hypothetical protein